MTTLYSAQAKENKIPITERVKTFEDACQVLGIDAIKFEITGMDSDVGSIAAYMKLIVIARALNEGWKPNWANSNEYKYVPWFKENGFGLSFVYCAYWFSITFVGSRLCFKSRELAEYAGKQFESIYQEYLTIKPE